MALTWNLAYSTGLEWQDNQHRELFERINALLDALGSSEGQSPIGEVVTFLEKYIIAHFGDEERWMIQYKLPCYRAHKAAHDGFIRSFGELKAGMSQGATPLTITIKLQELLTRWLIDHIGKADTAFARELAAATTA